MIVDIATMAFRRLQHMAPLEHSCRVLVPEEVIRATIYLGSWVVITLTQVGGLGYLSGRVCPL